MKIAPFYSGQKVVCVDAGHYSGALSLGSTYTVAECMIVCRCGWLVSLVGIKETLLVVGIGPIAICNDCGRSFPRRPLHMFFAHRFRPLQESKMPLIKLSQIKETEKEQVLIEN